jgi:hypothetical protein
VKDSSICEDRLSSTTCEDLILVVGHGLGVLAQGKEFGLGDPKFGVL